LTLGANVSGISDFWTGDIALVRIYDQEVSGRRARCLAKQPWLQFVRRDDVFAGRLTSLPPGLLESGQVIGAA
jgi:hypothetical protein